MICRQVHGGVLADELPGGGGVEDLGGSILVCLVLKQGMGFFRCDWNIFEHL